jgi:hypothetical protein
MKKLHLQKLKIFQRHLQKDCHLVQDFIEFLFSILTLLLLQIMKLIKQEHLLLLQINLMLQLLRISFHLL